jgi:magnesium transporter
MIRKLPKIFNEKDYQNPELLEDVMIELKQAQNMVNIYSDILTGTMDAFASIISNNVNTIMKRMTSLSIVLMVPTLIASFYGMNVDIHFQHLLATNDSFACPNLHPCESRATRAFAHL